MDIHSLDKALQGYYFAALASSTHKTYKAAERRYASFCEKFEVNPLPASKSTLCYFVTWLGQEGLQHSTIRTYLSGVCQNQIAHGFPDLKFDSILRRHQILQGIKVIPSLQRHPKRIRLPITLSILWQMKQICGLIKKKILTKPCYGQQQRLSFSPLPVWRNHYPRRKNL